MAVLATPIDLDSKITVQRATWQELLAEIAKFMALAAVVTAIVAAVALFAYLRKIGWPELLQPSLGSREGLVMVVVSLSFVLLSFGLTFFGSVFWIHVAARTYEGPLCIPRQLPKLILALQFAWSVELLCILLGFHWSKTASPGWCLIPFIWLSRHVPLAMFSFIGIGILISVCLHAAGRARLRKAHQAPAISAACSLRDALKDGWRGFLLAYASLNASLAIWAFFSMNPALDDDANSLWVTVAAIALIWPSMIVGVVYLDQYRQTGVVRNSVLTAGTLAAILAAGACVVFPAVTIVQFDMLALRAISVFSELPRTYELTKEGSKGIFKRTGFDIPETVPLTFTGYERYRFGDVLLLCTRTYSPLKTPGQPATSPPSGAKAISKDGCLRVAKDEVRRFDVRE